MPQEPGEGTGEIVAGGVFAFFSLEGERFEAQGMPADAAREVSNYREAIVKVAREIWLNTNPGRRRLPNGFYGAFDLRLIGVEQGSALPQLVLQRPARGVDDDEWDEWSGIYALARDVLTESLASAETAEEAKTSFSGDAMRAIHRIGASLHEDDVLTVGEPRAGGRRARVDQETRRVLTAIEADVALVPTQSELLGVITEYDGNKRSFNLDTAEGTSVCRLEHFNERLADTARRVLALDGVTAPDVIVEGETLDETSRPVRLFNVTSIRIERTMEQKVLLRQLSNIEALSDGWLGVGSEAPSRDVIDRVESIVSTLASLGTPVALVPNADGAVVAEWRRGTSEFSAAIEPGGEMFLCADDTESEALVESQSPYDDRRLLAFLTRGIIE